MFSIKNNQVFTYSLEFSLNCFPPIIFIIAAYKHADGKKIDGRRVLVDVERARTVKGWLPRRLGKLILHFNLTNYYLLLTFYNNDCCLNLGGGLGGTRRGGPEVNLKHSGREDNERERERYAREMAGSRSGRSVTMERDRERDYRDRDRDRDRDARRPRSRDRERKRHRSKSYVFNIYYN